MEYRLIPGGSASVAVIEDDDGKRLDTSAPMSEAAARDLRNAARSRGVAAFADIGKDTPALVLDPAPAPASTDEAPASSPPGQASTPPAKPDADAKAKAKPKGKKAPAARKRK
jgi:hypothetical protein